MTDNSPLTYPNNKKCFERLVANICEDYFEGDCRFCFIRHNENMTFRVSTGDNSDESNNYLLRLHYPLNPIYIDKRQQLPQILSELQWLKALSRDTGIQLQHPICNKSQQMIGRYPFVRSQPKVTATMLSWLPGQQLNHDALTEEIATEIGQLQAMLHQHASQWSLPNNFQRPTLDQHSRDYLASIYPGIKKGLFSKQHYTNLSLMLDKLIDNLPINNKEPQLTGIIHGDLHKGNLLRTDSGIRPIDFFSCKLGNYLYDTAVTLLNLKARFHPSYFEGYRSIRPLPPNAIPLIESYSLLAIIATIASLVHDPKGHHWIKRHIDTIAIVNGNKYLNNERLKPQQ